MPAAKPETAKRRSPGQSPDDLQTASPGRRLRAPLLDGTGKKAKDLTLDEGVFGADLDLASLLAYRKDFPALQDMRSGWL